MPPPLRPSFDLRPPPRLSCDIGFIPSRFSFSQFRTEGYGEIAEPNRCTLFPGIAFNSRAPD